MSQLPHENYQKAQGGQNYVWSAYETPSGLTKTIEISKSAYSHLMHLRQFVQHANWPAINKVAEALATHAAFIADESVPVINFNHVDLAVETISAFEISEGY